MKWAGGKIKNIIYMGFSGLEVRRFIHVSGRHIGAPVSSSTKFLLQRAAAAALQSLTLSRSDRRR
jgi:hypothetical protein